jgi:predicted metal-dependent enzyme (double-stranded beta helix superfamily)
VDLDGLFADLVAAAGEDTPQLAVRDVLARALDDRAALAEALPCTRAEFVPLVVTPDLTIIKTVWAPGMTVPPHDHRMWGAIAVFTGKEDNTYYRRAGAGLEQSGGKELRAGDVGLMGTDIIHSVTAPLTREWTGAVHVYGGDFVAQQRSMWIDGVEEPSDSARTAAIFEAANRDLA